MKNRVIAGLVASLISLIGASAPFGQGVVARSGVDNVTAVPEPDNGWRLVAGCAALAAGRSLRAAATRRPVA